MLLLWVKTLYAWRCWSLVDTKSTRGRADTADPGGCVVKDAHNLNGSQEFTLPSKQERASLFFHFYMGPEIKLRIYAVHNIWVG
jgi:hypothetical protein